MNISSAELFSDRCIGVSSIRNKLGENICGNILFVHAFLGCDTTSRLFGIGKAAGLKLVKENETLREQAEVFRSVKSSNDQVIAAGERAMTIVQKGNLNDHQDTMRYQSFQELVTTRKKAIHPSMLPPTSAATKYHSLRVFHQVQQWQGNTLPAEDWGWELSEGRLKPVNSDFGPAHQSLLDIVRCTCETGCGTLRGGAADRECHVRLLVLNGEAKTCRIMMWMITRTVTLKFDCEREAVTVTSLRLWVSVSVDLLHYRTFGEA